MSEVGEGGSPRGELSPQRNTHQEAESADNTLSRLMRDDETWSERSHEEMVEGIRRDMAQWRAKKDPYRFDPVGWMRDRLAWELAKQAVAENIGKSVELGDRPHAQLMLAWDIIALPHYTNAYTRGLAENGIRDRGRTIGHTITLDTKESKLLDAMAEAVGIPNTYGQLTNEKKV